MSAGAIKRHEAAVISAWRRAGLLQVPICGYRQA